MAAVAEAMRYLDDIASQREHQREAKRKQDLMNYWLQYRRGRTGRFGVNSYHRCTLDCNMCPFIPGKYVYGCLESGIMHECKIDRSSCRVYTNRDGMLICVFSHLILGPVLMKSFFNPNIVPANEGYGDGGGASSLRVASQKKPLPKRQWTGSTVDLSPNIDGGGGGGGGGGGSANKPSGGKRKRKRRRKTPIPLFLADAYAVPGSGGGGGRGGLSLSAPPGLGNRRREEHAGVLRAEVEGIMSDLIWDNTTRRYLSQEREDRSMAKAMRLLRTYVDECINDDPPVRPRTCDLDRIWNTTLEQARPQGQSSSSSSRFVKRERDLAREDRYVHIALKMWRLAQSVDSCREHKFAVRFRPFSVGLLYTMAKGPIVMTATRTEEELFFSEDFDREAWLSLTAEQQEQMFHETYVILEKDEWLAARLPLPKELCEYQARPRRRVQKKIRGSLSSSSWAGSGRSGGGDSYSRGDITKGGNYVQVIMQEYKGELTPAEIRRMLTPSGERKKKNTKF